MFPDVEKALVDLLEQFAATGTVTPDDLGMAPFIRVGRIGGPDDGVTDLASVDVDSFALTRTAAFDLANLIRAFLSSAPHVVDGVVIDLVRTDVGPRELPWDNPRVRRFGATYTVSTRRSRL